MASAKPKSSRAETEHETFFGIPVDELTVDPIFLALMAERVHAHGGDPQQWDTLRDIWACDDCRSSGPGRATQVCGGDGVTRDGKEREGCGSSNVWPVGRGLAPDDAAERKNKRAVWAMVETMIERPPVVSRDVMLKAFPGKAHLFPVAAPIEGTGGAGEAPEVTDGLPPFPVCAFCLGRPAAISDDNPSPNPLGDIEHKTGCRWWKLSEWFAKGTNGVEPAT